MFITSVIFLFVAVINGVLAVESNLLKEYDSKVCSNVPSCHLSDNQNLPAIKRTLQGRDCMCDFECVDYNDCCKDSEFYGSHPIDSSKSFFCSPNGQIYMLTTCPPEYTDQKIINKCLASNQPLEGEDISVIRPATNTRRRITYGNAYCALCNNDLEIILWNLTSGCGEAPSNYFTSYTYQSNPGVSYETPEENEVSTPSKNLYANKNSAPGVLNFKLPIGSNFFDPNNRFSNTFKLPGTGGLNIQISRSRRQTPQLDLQKNAKDLDKILNYVNYDPYTKQFVSNYNGKKFICQFGTQIPQNFDLYVRKCVPNLIESCPPGTDKETADNCRLYTAVVYEKFTKIPYKNRECAKCNGIADINLTGCPQGIRTSSTILFGVSNKSTGAPCDTPALRKFC